MLFTGKTVAVYRYLLMGYLRGSFDGKGYGETSHHTGLGVFMVDDANSRDFNGVNA